MDATGRPDESLALEVAGSLQPRDESFPNDKVMSLSLQKGQLRANVCFRPLYSANLEVHPVSLMYSCFKQKTSSVLSNVKVFIEIGFFNFSMQLRNLPLDELELASLRGMIQRVCSHVVCRGVYIVADHSFLSSIIDQLFEYVGVPCNGLGNPHLKS